MKSTARLALLAFNGVLLCACHSHSESAAPVRPVQSTVIRFGAAGEPVSLSGQIQAQNQANLAFRIAGRLVERRVSVGDTVTIVVEPTATESALATAIEQSKVTTQPKKARPDAVEIAPAKARKRRA